MNERLEILHSRVGNLTTVEQIELNILLKEPENLEYWRINFALTPLETNALPREWMSLYLYVNDWEKKCQGITSTEKKEVE